MTHSRHWERVISAALCVVAGLLGVVLAVVR